MKRKFINNSHKASVHVELSEVNPFTKLPDEVVTQIFDYIPSREVPRLRLVNKDFKDIVDRYCDPEFETITIDPSLDSDEDDDNNPMTLEEINGLKRDLTKIYAASHPETPAPMPLIPRILKKVYNVKYIGSFLQFMLFPRARSTTGIFDDLEPANLPCPYYREKTSYGPFKDIDRTFDMEGKEVELKVIRPLKRSEIKDLEAAHTRSGKKFR